MTGRPWVVSFWWTPHVSAQQKGDDRPALELPVRLDGLAGRLSVSDDIVRRGGLLGRAVETETLALAFDLARVVDGTTVEGGRTYPEKMATAAFSAISVAAWASR